MSNTDGTCEYVLDPDDHETWGGEEGEEWYLDEEVLNEEGVWRCQHESEEGEDLCIFHLPVSEKNDEKAVDAFVETLTDASTSDDPMPRKLQFLGAKFGDFDLSQNPPDIIVNDGKLVMDYAEIAGLFNWSGSCIDISSISLAEMRCFGSTRFIEAEFGGDIRLEEAEFGGDADFRGARFEGDTYFSGAEFGGDAEFREAKFEGDTYFPGAEFEGSADFRQTVFEGDASFIGAEFEYSTFRRAEFRQDAGFRRTKFRQGADFAQTNFQGYIEFVGAEFLKATSFTEAEFGGDADFTVAEFGRDIFFTWAEFGGEIEFNRADLTDVNLTETKLRGTNFESALLSRATLFGADLRGTRLAGTVLGDVRIDEATQFLGHPSYDSNASPHTLSAILSRPKCVYDPDYEEDNEHADVDKAKSVYRALEELGGKHARPRLQARSFVRRKDLQKQDYWDDATADDASLEERLIAGLRYSRAKVARATLLYGESPWRVITWSLGIIVGFALLFPLGGWMKPEGGDPITYAQIANNPAEILNSVYYSTLTYTALGFGDFQPVGFGRLLTTVETGLGAVLIALLVFVLGRRAAR